MKVLLDTVTPAFDWVILDSPPCLPVHDASSLADLCDGVLFVVRAAETDHEADQRSICRTPISLVRKEIDQFVSQKLC